MKPKLIVKSILIISLILVSCSKETVQIQTEQEITQEQYEETKQVTEQSPKETIDLDKVEWTDVSDNKKEEPVFKARSKKINKDHIGIIRIPYLDIDENVFYTGDSYYLRRDLNGNISNAGEIYIDGRSGDDIFEHYLVINGHNMINKTKFGNLKKLKNIEPNTKVFIYYDDFLTNKTIKYRIFAVNNIKTRDFYPKFTFTDLQESERIKYLSNLYNSSLVKFKEPEYKNTITLNTCSKVFGTEHLLVSAEIEGIEN